MYRYIGQNEYYTGVPARDLTADDMAALSDEQRDLVLTGHLYEQINETPATAPEEGSNGR